MAAARLEATGSTVGSVGKRSRRGSRYADHIGRVGALAVALGVGAAVALAVPGIAAADPTDSGSAETSSESSSESASESTSSEPSSESGDDDSPLEDADDETPTEDLPEDTETEEAETEEDETEPVIDPVEPSPGPDGESPDVATPIEPEQPSVHTPSDADKPTADNSQNSADDVDVPKADGADEAEPTEAVTAPTSVFAVDDTVPVAAAALAADLPSARTMTESSVRPESRPAPPDSVGAITGLVVAVLRAFGIDASATTVPHHPVATFGWTVAAFVRREIQTLLDRRPAIDVDQTAGQNGTVELVVTTFDPDRGDVVTVSTTAPAHGTLVQTGPGHWTYTPDAAYAHSLSANGSTVPGNDTFTFVATDRFGKSVTSEQTVTIAPQNAAPTIGSVVSTLNEDGTTTLTVPTSDTDGDTVTVIATKPEHGSVVKNVDGTFTYTPDADYALSLGEGASTTPGSDAFKFVATDAHGGLRAVDQTVTITPQYPAPIVTSVTPTQSASGATVLVVKTSYNDGVPVTVTAGGAAYGVVAPNVDGTFTYTPDPVVAHQASADGAAQVNDEVIFVVTDQTGAQTYHTAALVVTPANTAPQITGVTSTANADGTTTLVVGTTDADGDTVTVTASGATKGAVVKNADGSFTYKPTTGATGTDTITFTADDGHNGKTTTKVVVSASVPKVGAPSYDSAVDTSTGVVTGSVNVTDDGPLTYTLSGAPDPSVGTVVVDSATGDWTFTPTAAARMKHYYAGAANSPDSMTTFTIVASDGTASVAVPVTATISPAGLSEVDKMNVSGGAPIAVATSTDGTRVYVTGSGVNTVPVFEADNDYTAQTTLSTEKSKPFDITVSGDYAYVSNFGSNSVTVIDTVTNDVVTTIVVGTKPTNLAASPDGTRLYVTNAMSNDVSVIDIDPTSDTYNTVIKTVNVGSEPLGVTVSADGTRAYVANSVSGTVTVINTDTYAVVRTITVGEHPHSLAVSEDGTRLYVTNYGDSTDNGTVSVIDIDATSATVNRVIDTIDTGQKGSYDIAVAGDLAFVTNLVSNTVSVIDLSTNTAVAEFDTGNSPYGVTVSPDQSTVYVVNWADNTVSVFGIDGSAAANSATAVAAAVVADDEVTPSQVSQPQSAEPISVQAAKSSTPATVKYQIVNVSQEPVTFVGYYTDSDFDTVQQAANITLQPGESHDVYVSTDKPSNTYLQYEAENGDVYQVGLSWIAGGMDYQVVGCRTASGTSECSPDAQGERTGTVLLEGQPGGTVVYAADQVQEQGELVDALCSSSGVTCSFAPVSYVKTYGSPHLPTNFTPLDNSAYSTPSAFSYTMTDTVTDTTSFTVTSTTLVGVKDVASTSVALAYGQTQATTNTYTQKFDVTVPAGEVGYLYHEAPVIRYNGTWTIAAPNTTWVLQGAYYEVPDPDRPGVIATSGVELVE